MFSYAPVANPFLRQTGSEVCPLQAFIGDNAIDEPEKLVNRELHMNGRELGLSIPFPPITSKLSQTLY